MTTGFYSSNLFSESGTSCLLSFSYDENTLVIRNSGVMHLTQHEAGDFTTFTVSASLKMAKPAVRMQQLGELPCTSRQIGRTECTVLLLVERQRQKPPGDAIKSKILTAQLFQRCYQFIQLQSSHSWVGRASCLGSRGWAQIWKRIGLSCNVN